MLSAWPNNEGPAALKSRGTDAGMQRVKRIVSQYSDADGKYAQHDALVDCLAMSVKAKDTSGGFSGGQPPNIREEDVAPCLTELILFMGIQFLHSYKMCRVSSARGFCLRLCRLLCFCEPVCMCAGLSPTHLWGLVGHTK
jgi:hypothetical protein